MSGKIRHITRRVYPTKVWIITGAPAELVSHRHLRGQYATGTGKGYETNQNIKYWATWFLLKSLTTTSYIQHWISQKKYLLEWVQMNENTFRRHLAWLQKEELIEVDKNTYSIRLCGYEAAAEKLDIAYEGVYSVDFNPRKFPGKQTFQWLIRTEEFEHHKQRQLEALMYKLDNNPSLKNDLVYEIVQLGADSNRLANDTAYFADRLLRLQTKLFREGSDIFQYIMSLRADINRGVKKIKQDHRYRGFQSVAYMKRKMAKLGFARIWKICVNSEARMRFSIPIEQDTPVEKRHGSVRDGYKYIKKTKKTAWFLTDQVSRQYPSNADLTTLKSAKYAA